MAVATAFGTANSGQIHQCSIKFDSRLLLILGSWCAFTGFHKAVAFQQPRPTTCFGLQRPSRRRCHLFSSIGGGSSNGGGSGEGNEGEWGDFLDPRREESENLQRARDHISDNSLPISYEEEGETEGVFDSEADDDGEEEEELDTLVENEAEHESAVSEGKLSSALVGPKTPGMLGRGNLTEEALARNPYLAVVSRLSPSELISRFTSTAPSRVQNAVRSTILGLIGGLPKMAFDTTTVTTGQRLASLMFQLQMTGYMFKNADYRLSLKQSLGADAIDSQFLLSSGKKKTDPLNGKVKGKIRVAYGSPLLRRATPASESNNHSEPEGIEVDAQAYMAELRTEVSQLRDELMVTRKEKEEALRKDLLLYIRTLPQKELRGLTNNMSEDVLIAMKGLVQAVMTGIGEGQIGPETVTEQSSEAMAQLCMWQLAIGYNLRTLEVREEMKNVLATGSSDDDDDTELKTEPGILE